MKTNGTSDVAPAHDIFGSFDVEAVAAEVSRLHSEIAITENSALTVAEELAALGRQLEADIEVFRANGLELDFTLSPPLAQRQFRQAVRGAIALVGGEGFLSVEKERVRHRVSADPRPRMSAAERTAKLAELRNQLRRVMAHYEIAMRGREGDREVLPRAPQCISGELFLASDTDLRQWERG
jgi:hypothetical protein